MMELLKGKYLLEHCLGRGGMAEVFAGRTVGAAGFSRRVAIKRILPTHGLDAQFREMFVSEARLGSLLRHDNIVRVFDFDQDEAGCLFLVMEFVDGVDLAGLVQTGLLPLPAVLFVTAEVLRGLAYVDELPLVEGGPRGLVHRDISPQNVLLSWDGAVQISDFGIAKARTATQAGASVLIKGKPAYMSPEQARGLPLDGRSDVFAVGIMLWEMLCGQALFHDPDDLRATLAAVMFGDAPPPSARARRPVPPDVERVTMQLLRRDRDARPDAASALAAVTACADYPRSGREALAALLAARLPERAPRRGSRQIPGPAPSGDPPAAAAASYATPTAVPQVRHHAMPVRDRRSALAPARRRYLRGALLGAAMIGALVVGMMHVVRPSNSSAAQRTPSVRPVRPVDAPHAAPAPASGSGSTHAVSPRTHAGAPERSGVDAQHPTTGAVLVETINRAPERTEPPRRDDRGSMVRNDRARAPAPVRPPARGGMRIIDLHPATPEPDPTVRLRRDSRELDLGSESK